MKLLVVLATITALCAGNAIPLVPGDNSHYVEGESRYIWMPDGKGVPRLVDLHARPSEEELARAMRSGADNQYWLYTRLNPNTAQIITHGDESTITSSNYLASRPLKVIVHGWNNNGDSNVNVLLRAAFLAVQDCNVIVVDWSDLAGSLYWTAVVGVPDVGVHVGDFVTWLINTAGGDWDNVHFVGHSLGAHVVGNAGRQTGNLPRRITGMDPAGPEFGGSSHALRSSDGQYVECIHTDGGVLGIMDPICRANFYPNGGRNQPGCLLPTCSHSRSYELMDASIRFNHLVGRLCNSVADAQVVNCSGTQFQMGNAVIDKDGNGLYGLRTTSSFPF